ncbi:redox-regulated ATPase YchF [Candidatus Microgenomates bacterium]|nr:redox-regulated ATPase YchF [Candidatus Microgenomates bacterium]
MSLSVGIIGLPNVGKSTLFNALLKKRVALSANYPFATVEPNVGVVAVPDERLNKLAGLVKNEEKMESLPPLVPAVVEFVDIAGLVKGAHKGAGLGNQFLSHIREVDAIVHVLRDFEDPNVIREGSENPKADRETIETELGLADLQTLEKMIAGQKKNAKTSKDPLEFKKVDVLNELKKTLDSGGSLGKFKVEPFDSTQSLRDERLKDWFEHLPLLSIKPILYVFNVGEKEYAEEILRLASLAQDDNVVAICAKLEEELADYSDEERSEYLKSLGPPAGGEKTGLERLIVKAYNLLGLISYLTAGKKEVRAWTIKKGTLAPQAAGVIHTDFEKKFIRAQVIEYGKIIETGSFALAKQKGWLRSEGRDYEMKDGDVVEFLIGT